MRRLKYKLIGTGIIQCLDAVNVGKRYATFTLRKEAGLTIYPIPPYSPELNIIEIIWRKIKYEWLPFSAYESYQSLERELFNVLAHIGGSHKVAFS